MEVYRDYILGCKRKFGSARGLVHYKDYLKEYCDAKKDVINGKEA